MRKPYGQEPWRREQLASAVAESHSIAGVLMRLGCTVSGTNYRWVHRLVAKYQIDASHFLGRAYLRGKHHSWSPLRPLSEILVENSLYADLNALKRRLVLAGLLSYECAVCGIAE